LYKKRGEGKGKERARYLKEFSLPKRCPSTRENAPTMMGKERETTV